MGIDSFTSTEHEGGLSRIGGSFGAAIFGIVLFLASFPLLWWNEGRSVARAKALAEGREAAVSVTSERVDSANEGKLVHVTGTAETEAVLKDDVFGVEGAGLRLRRTVEMYQWEEEKKTKSKKKVGGGRTKTTTYTYDKVWSGDLIDSSEFEHPEGHANPEAMRWRSATWAAENVRLGAFTLSPAQVGRIDAWEPVGVTSDHLKRLALGDGVTAHADGGGLYVGADPASPAVGDLRVRFRLVPATVLSLMSGQAGASFAPWITSNEGSIDLLQLGTHTKEKMISKAESDNALLTWLLRLGGFLAMAIGLAMVFSPLTAVADVIPFVGSLVGAGIAFFAGLVSIALSSLTIGLAWLFYRPMIGIPMLILTAGCMVLLLKMGKAKKAAAA